jgi:hypothetical protein
LLTSLHTRFVTNVIHTCDTRAANRENNSEIGRSYVPWKGASTAKQVLAPYPHLRSVEVDNQSINQSPVIVQPCDKICGIPVRGWGLPFTVRPDHIRFVRIHQLIQLRHGLELKKHTIIFMWIKNNNNKMQPNKQKTSTCMYPRRWKVPEICNCQQSNMVLIYFPWQGNVMQ